MTAKDRSSETVTKIVTNSITLFSQKGFAGTSINDIAKHAGLSKGILYHYFTNKDDLYLHCAKTCINSFKEHLCATTGGVLEKENGALELLKARLHFFETNPVYKNFFYDIVAGNPEHLSNDLFEIRRSFRDENMERFSATLKHLPLGKGITNEDVKNLIVILEATTQNTLKSLTDTHDQQAHEKAILRIATIFINGLKEDIE